MSDFGGSVRGRGGFRGASSSSFGDNQNDSGFGGRGGRGGGRGGFNQQSSGFGNSQSESSGFGGGRGGFSSSNFGDNQNENSGFSGRGGRGGGRGGFNQSNDTQGESSGFGGGRGGSRGGFNQTSNNNESSGFGGGRGGGRGGFNQSNDTQGESSGFGGGRGGGRGGFNQTSNNNESSGFGGGRGGGRGGFNQSNDTQGESSGFGGGRGGGRGGFSSGFGDNQNENSGFSGRGGRGGGRGGFNQSNDNQNESSGFGGGRGGGRGGFSSNFGDNQNENSGFSSRGGRGGGRGGFSSSNFGDNQSESSGFGGGRGGGRGGFSSSNFGDNQNENSGFSGRGGRGGGRGGFNQSNDTQGESSGFGGGRGGGRGGFGQSSGFANNDNSGFGQDRGGANKGQQDETQGNDGSGENAPVATPMGYVPTPRGIDELYNEDQVAAKDYADVVDTDENIVVENYSGDVVRISTWEEAELQPQLLKNITERSKYTRPRKIQSATIPFVLDGFDIKGQAETGSGKTAAFVVPIIESCMQAKNNKDFESELVSPFALIIGPTRELVMQVFEQAEKFAADTGISVAKAYGQYHIGKNHAEIRTGCDILCGTPGRLKQFITNGEICVKKLRFLVLDEADRLLDQNFSGDIMDIVSTQAFPDNTKRQTLLFSATFPPDVMNIADRLLRKEAVFVTNQRNNPNKRIKQDFIVCGRPEKLDKLASLLSEEAQKAGGGEKIRRTLVFVNTKRMSDMAALFLCQRGIPATSINGDRGQHLREQALRDFRTHKVSVLISTDVCARGIDVKELDHVINMDMPDSAITYVHRIGRTGRITQGFSTSFVESGDPLLEEIASMMREKNEEIPEALKSVLGGGGISFAPTSANSAPVQPKTATVAPTPNNGSKDDDEDW